MKKIIISIIAIMCVMSIAGCKAEAEPNVGYTDRLVQRLNADLNDLNAMADEYCYIAYDNNFYEEAKNWSDWYDTYVEEVELCLSIYED